jgi:hypothetical protein
MHYKYQFHKNSQILQLFQYHTVFLIGSALSSIKLEFKEIGKLPTYRFLSYLVDDSP